VKIMSGDGLQHGGGDGQGGVRVHRKKKRNMPKRKIPSKKGLHNIKAGVPARNGLVLDTAGERGENSQIEKSPGGGRRKIAQDQSGEK